MVCIWKHAFGNGTNSLRSLKIKHQLYHFQNGMVIQNFTVFCNLFSFSASIEMCNLHLKRAANEMSSIQNTTLYWTRTIAEFRTNIASQTPKIFSSPFPFSTCSQASKLSTFNLSLTNYSSLFPLHTQILYWPCFNPLLVLLPFVSPHAQFTSSMPLHRGIKTIHYLYWNHL